MSTAPPYHHGDLKAAILDTAEEMLADQPIEMVSMRELARKAGVSPGAPYHHFKDRSGLILALCQRGFSKLEERLTDPHFGNGIEDMIRGYLAFAQENPALYQLMFSAEATMDGRTEALHPYANPVSLLLTRKIEQIRGVDRTTEDDLSAVSIWCFMHGLASLSMASPIKKKLANTSMYDFANETVRKLLEVDR